MEDSRIHNLFLINSKLKELTELTTTIFYFTAFPNSKHLKIIKLFLYFIDVYRKFLRGI